MPQNDAAHLLEAAVRTADAPALVNWLAALPLAQRKALRGAARQLYKQMSTERWTSGTTEDGHTTHFSPTALGDARLGCAAQALALCGTADDVAGAWIESKDLMALAQRCELPCLDGLAEACLAQSPIHIGQVQELLAAGLVPRPTGEAYTIGLIALPRALHHQHNLLEYLRADPDVIPLLLDLFEVEGTGEYNLSAVDKYAKGVERQWDRIFLALCSEGFYTRATLLDHTLGTLERDWPQFRASWFSRFHDTLAPTVEEMAPHTARYLGLTQSRIPPTVTLALAALKALHAAGRVEGAALLAALQPVFFSSVKGQVAAALQLADTVVKREPPLAAMAATVALDGLQHEAADLQKKILDRLAKWGLDDAGRALLASRLDSVASVHRATAAALAGVEAASAPVQPLAAPVDAAPAGTGPADPFDPARALAPIADDETLVERAAFVLENPAEADELERVLEAMVRRAPFDDALRAQCGPLTKRARKLQDKAVAGPLARLMLRLLGEEGAIAPVPNWVKDDRMEKHLYARIQTLGDQALKGWGLPPLSAATHQGGFIAPALHAQRLVDYAAHGAKPAKAELDLAQQRLQRPGGAPQVAAPKWQVRSRSSTYADNTYTHHDLLLKPEPPTSSYDGAELNYLASQTPGALETFFAMGSREIGNNLDWWEAAWADRHFLLPLLWPVTPITAQQPMAVLLLALALAGKEPGQTATAVDVLVQSQQEGRLDGAALGQQLRALLATPLVKAKRYAASLQAAVRADARVAPTVVKLLCDMAAANIESPPKDLAALLVLLLELALSHQLPLPAYTRAALTAMKLSGKGRTVQRQLLDLPAA